MTRSSAVQAASFAESGSPFLVGNPSAVGREVHGGRCGWWNGEPNPVWGPGRKSRPGPMDGAEPEGPDLRIQLLADRSKLGDRGINRFLVQLNGCPSLRASILAC